MRRCLYTIEISFKVTFVLYNLKNNHMTFKLNYINLNMISVIRGVKWINNINN